MKRTYRAWVREGAHGFFLTPTIDQPRLVIVASAIVHPTDPAPGYVVEHMMFDPAHDGERPAGTLARKLVQRADDAVEAGWLTWLTIGDVVTGEPEPGR